MRTESDDQNELLNASAMRNMLGFIDADFFTVLLVVLGMRALALMICAHATSRPAIL
ncbi:MAG: hypothetical protein R8G34_10535 [Paracoccaceae bacterium]|nr:hypothetical protein [Paracoccaceae bacterium]